jgi:hypothetical protein
MERMAKANPQFSKTAIEEQWRKLVKAQGRK